MMTILYAACWLFAAALGLLVVVRRLCCVSAISYCLFERFGFFEVVFLTNVRLIYLIK